MFASILGHVKGIQMYEKGELSQQRSYKDIGVMLEGTNQSAAIFYPLWSVARDGAAAAIRWMLRLLSRMCVSRGQPTLRASRLASGVLTSVIQDSLATCASTLVLASVATVRAESVVNLDTVVPD